MRFNQKSTEALKIAVGTPQSPLSVTFQPAAPAEALRRQAAVVIPLSAFCFLLFLGGCGSAGSVGPNGPHTNPDGLTFSFCRVEQISGEMHVQWRANRPTHGAFRYGGTSLNHLVTEAAIADSHDVVLVGLQYSTPYLFQLTVYDSRGDTAIRSGEFTTPVRTSTVPVINGLQIAEITESAAKVSWRTDVVATTILYYGRASLSDSVVNDTLTFLHEVRLSALSPSATYLLKPEALDSTGLRGYGPDTLFSTVAQMMIWFPDTAIALGDTVRLPIYVADVEDLAALHLGLSFEPGGVELIDVEEGPFYSQKQGFIFFDDIRNSSGAAYADMTWSILFQNGQRTGTDADGGGIVAYARLRGLTTGDAHFAFLADSSFALDVYAVARSCSLRAGTVEVGP